MPKKSAGFQSLKRSMHCIKGIYVEQAGAELYQAQMKLGLAKPSLPSKETEVGLHKYFTEDWE